MWVALPLLPVVRCRHMFYRSHGSCIPSLGWDICGRRHACVALYYEYTSCSSIRLSVGWRYYVGGSRAQVSLFPWTGKQRSFCYR